MIPTRRFYLIMTAIGFVSVIFAVLLNQAVALGVLLTSDLTLLLLYLVDAQKIKQNLVNVSRQPQGRLSIGRENPVGLCVKTGKFPASILIRDSYPLEFSVSSSLLKANLASFQTETLIYKVNPDERGEFTWGNIHIRQLGRWGLAWYGWQIKAPQKVAVYPDLVGLRSLSIRLTLENTGTMRQARRLGIGTEFTELRDYNQGDDLRLIDWKATARRSSPLVRVLEPEREQPMIILLDRGRLMTAQVQGLKRFDWGLNATLSLALAGLSRGDQVAVGVFDRTLTTWIPPVKGQQQLGKILEQLTPIQPVLLEPDYLGVLTQVINRQSRRTLVVLITEIIDNIASTELLAAMLRLTPRYLPFCVALRDPQIEQIAHHPTEEIDGAYKRAVALDLLNQRQVAFSCLKQKGVLVLDAPANRVSEELVNSYLQLKARNRL